LLTDLPVFANYRRYLSPEGLVWDSPVASAPGLQAASAHCEPGSPGFEGLKPSREAPWTALS